ncbi:MAG: hypothetical protein SPI71_00285 [Acidaminococcaceae bacterium]|nr:hypothetical protein [Acidaminococcaceae bacterium]
MPSVLSNGLYHEETGLWMLSVILQKMSRLGHTAMDFCRHAE